MKRYTVIKNFINLLEENDILIFSGRELCREAYQANSPNCFYINESAGVAPAFGLGLAMCTDKRVFVFIGEGELLRELGIVAQIGVSRCQNFFLVVLDNKCYQTAGGHPTIFERLLSKKGLIFNSGSKVSTFTKHFQDKRFKRLKDRFTRFVGPLVILMDVDKGVNKSLEEIDINFIEQRDKLIEFAQNEDLETALFAPPLLPEVGEINALNLSELSSGGIS
jgi:hypothetical protein